MDEPPYPGTPRWVKVIGAVALLVLVLFVHRIVGRWRGYGHGSHPPAGTGR